MRFFRKSCLQNRFARFLEDYWTKIDFKLPTHFQYIFIEDTYHGFYEKNLKINKMTSVQCGNCIFLIEKSADLYNKYINTFFTTYYMVIRCEVFPERFPNIVNFWRCLKIKSLLNVCGTLATFQSHYYFLTKSYARFQYPYVALGLY